MTLHSTPLHCHAFSFDKTIKTFHDLSIPNFLLLSIYSTKDAFFLRTPACCYGFPSSLSSPCSPPARGPVAPPFLHSSFNTTLQTESCLNSLQGFTQTPECAQILGQESRSRESTGNVILHHHAVKKQREVQNPRNCCRKMLCCC